MSVSCQEQIRLLPYLLNIVIYPYGYTFFEVIKLTSTFITLAASIGELILLVVNCWLSLVNKLFWQSSKQYSSLHKPFTVIHLSFANIP